MENKTVVVSARFPESVHDRLVKVADKERRTKANLILVLVEEALKARQQAQGG